MQSKKLFVVLPHIPFFWCHESTAPTVARLLRYSQINKRTAINLTGRTIATDGDAAAVDTAAARAAIRSCIADATLMIAVAAACLAAANKI